MPHTAYPDYHPRSILVTGGAGFIGSNFVRTLIDEKTFDARIIVLDALTYAGNLENFDDRLDAFTFIHGDICDFERVCEILKEHAVDTVIHFAAESHVDRSILGPLIFTRTNVLGTHALLEAARLHGIRRFLHISTDEVYGSLGPEGAFSESWPIDATSPYAASKAASDTLVLSYVKTFGFPAIITRCSNNYGPYQFPEKFIPLMIVNAMRDMRLPVYGDGRNVREWIHTRDHTDAITVLLRRGRPGEIYNIGSGDERPNIDVARIILDALSKPDSLLQFVEDRLAHDRRYAIDSTKLRTELGWAPRISFDDGIRETISWYRTHPSWWERVISGDYRLYYETQYAQRFLQHS